MAERLPIAVFGIRVGGVYVFEDSERDVGGDQTVANGKG